MTPPGGGPSSTTSKPTTSRDAYKTAGTSLEIALSQHCGPDDVITRFKPAEDEQQRADLGFPGAQNDELPLAANSPRGLASAVRHRQKPRHFDHMPASQIRKAVGRQVFDSYFKFTIERNPFDKAISRYWWATRHKDSRPDLTKYLMGSTDRLTDWPLYSDHDNVLVDYVMRYEELAHDVACVGAHLGIDLSLPDKRAKGGVRADERHYSEVMSPIARRRIETVCWRELSAFGYSWQAP